MIEMSRTKWANVIADAVDFLLLRNVIDIKGGKILPLPEEIPILRYYANAIRHWQTPADISRKDET